MNNLPNLNFAKINAVAYENEERVVKELLEYLTPEYNSKINNIKDRQKILKIFEKYVD